jgi:hypothetical protein
VDKKIKKIHQKKKIKFSPPVSIYGIVGTNKRNHDQKHYACINQSINPTRSSISIWTIPGIVLAPFANRDTTNKPPTKKRQSPRRHRGQARATKTTSRTKPRPKANKYTKRVAG